MVKEAQVFKNKILNLNNLNIKCAKDPNLEDISFMSIKSTLHDKTNSYQNGVETHARGWQHKHIRSPKAKK